MGIKQPKLKECLETLREAGMSWGEGWWWRRADSRPLFYVFRRMSFCAGISGSLVIHCGP